MESELKLLVRPRDHARLARCAALAAARPRRQRLETLYFDTPDGELAGRDLALRLRRAGKRWIAGLKARQLGAGGLHVREEWEHAREDAVLDLALFAGTPLAALPASERLHERLRPAFRVSMERTTWRLAPAPGSRLEVALDRGEVSRDGSAEPLSELEIECLEGDIGAAFDLARALLREVPLRPGAVSKAERGYRLFRGEPLAPVKAFPVVLDPGEALPAAARRVVAAALRQLQANEEGVLASGDPEFVHQARIALRRLRAAIRMFRGAIGHGRARAWRRELAATARGLGTARDWDVFATETLPAALADFGDAALRARVMAAVESRRGPARSRARRALASRRYAATVLEIARWLASREGAGPSRPPPLERFAARLLRRRHRRVLRGLRRIRALDGEERHRLRIGAKRLRYGMDALAPVFGEERVRPYLRALSQLQDRLGEANDAVTAAKLLGELPAPARFRRFAAARFAGQARGDEAALERLAHRLEAAFPLR